MYYFCSVHKIAIFDIDTASVCELPTYCSTQQMLVSENLYKIK